MAQAKATIRVTVIVPEKNDILAETDIFGLLSEDFTKGLSEDEKQYAGFAKTAVSVGVSGFDPMTDDALRLMPLNDYQSVEDILSAYESAGRAGCLAACEPGMEKCRKKENCFHIVLVYN